MHLSFADHPQELSDAHLLILIVNGIFAPFLLLSRLLRIAAHDLDLVRLNSILIVELKVNVFDQERPDFIAKAVGIQMALYSATISCSL